jgi:hypothetical protein
VRDETPDAGVVGGGRRGGHHRSTGIPAHAQTRVFAPEIQTVSLARLSLTGVVVDERGGPIQGAMVTVAGRTTATTISDDQGRFAVEHLPPGEYMLRAHLSGFIASPRKLVRVGGTAGDHHLQMRRLDAAVGTAGGPDETVPSRPIIAAGFDLPRAETPSDAPAAAGEDHPHTEIAWRLRHLRRSILKNTSPANALFEPEDRPGSAAPWHRLIRSRRRCSPTSRSPARSICITTGSYGSDIWSNDGMPRGVAYFSVGSRRPWVTGSARRDEPGRSRVVGRCRVVRLAP